MSIVSVLEQHRARELVGNQYTFLLSFSLFFSLFVSHVSLVCNVKVHTLDYSLGAHSLCKRSAFKFGNNFTSTVQERSVAGPLGVTLGRLHHALDEW